MEVVVLRTARLCQKVFAACRALYFENHLAATACIYLHRYIKFMTESQVPAGLALLQGDDEAASGRDGIIVLTATLFLVGKCAEEVRRPRDVLNVVRSTFGHLPDTLEMGEAYHILKEQIIQREHTLLRVLGFNTQVDLPHPYLLNIANFLGLKQAPVKAAWRMLNDLYLRAESCTVRPVACACACLFIGIATTLPGDATQQIPCASTARLFEPFEVQAGELAAVADLVGATQLMFAVSPETGDITRLRALGEVDDEGEVGGEWISGAEVGGSSGSSSGSSSSSSMFAKGGSYVAIKKRKADAVSE